MLRRLYALVLLVVIFLSCVEADAAVNSRRLKNAASVLTDCSIYQLGESEFIMKLYGNKLPEPEVISHDNSLSIMLEAKASLKSKSLREKLDAVALVNDIELEIISADKIIFTLQGNSPLSVYSCSRNQTGLTFRIKTSVNDNLFPKITITPRRQTIYPQSSLPFQADSHVTLELRDAELRDVFRMLMAHLGRNVIIDPSFPADVLVTMTLVDVRADEIIEYLMRTYDISCYTAGPNTIAFGTREGLYKLSGGTRTQAFTISYAQPSDVKTLLTTLAGLQDNNIVVDERLRTVWITANPAKMEDVTDLISRLDEPGRQVMIQASIFEFNDTATVDVENALAIAYDEWRMNFGGRGGIGLDYQEDRSPRGRTPRTARTIQANFTALERKGKGKVIANPSVIATDGHEANISLTEDYPYISERDDSGNPTWDTEEIGPQLTFTPRIGRDGYVTLTLEVQTGDVLEMITGSTGEQMPRTSTRSVTTEIRVHDGMPFVIGGLFSDNRSDETYRIPVIGSIPFLGELFSYKSQTHNKSQVVIVVTPYILDSD